MMNAIGQKEETTWFIEINGRLFRWCMTASDDGIEVHVQFYEEGGTLLVINGLTFDPVPDDWRWGGRFDEILYNNLNDRTIHKLVELALERGWRHDLEQQIFRLC
jgi:hypothetical protein